MPITPFKHQKMYKLFSYPIFLFHNENEDVRNLIYEQGIVNQLGLKVKGPSIGGREFKQHIFSGILFVGDIISPLGVVFYRKSYKI